MYFIQKVLYFIIKNKLWHGDRDKWTFNMTEKDRAIADRKSVRAGFTKTYNKLEALLKPESEANDDEINITFLTVNDRFPQLRLKDAAVQQHLTTEEEFDKEYEGVEA